MVRVNPEMLHFNDLLQLTVDPFMMILDKLCTVLSPPFMMHSCQVLVNAVIGGQILHFIIYLYESSSLFLFL